MNQFVLDSSVIIKWLIPENPDEQNVAEALALLYALRAGTIAVRQPCHWLAEIAAVGVRLKPVVFEPPKMSSTTSSSSVSILIKNAGSSEGNLAGWRSMPSSLHIRR